MATATMNPFDLLGDDDNGDTSPIDLVKEMPVAKKTPAAAPPAAKQAPPAKVQPGKVETRNGFASRGGRGGRFGGRGQDFGYSNRGRGNYNAERFSRNGYNNDNNNGYGGTEPGDFGGNLNEDGEAGRSGERGRGFRGRFRGRGGRGPFRRGVFNGAGDSNDAEENEDGARPKRFYDRRSGTGRGAEIKRDGAGRGNWGTATDQGPIESRELEETQNVEEEKAPGAQEEGTKQEGNEENPSTDVEKKEEEEDKEMTLDEYEKVLEEKRKNLLAMKSAERRVDPKQFDKMERLAGKKDNDEVFIKLGSDKETARKEATEKEEKAKKSMSINEFLKPADGETYYSPGGRGRGRGRGRGGYRGGFNGGGSAQQSSPQIEDPGQFPALGGN